jgi:Fe-S cluster assembly protein SufD
VTTATQATNRYLECFSEFERSAAGREVKWLADLRRRAFSRFCEIGFPTTHNEDWRFTDVSAISNSTFQLGKYEGVSASQLKPWRVAGAKCQLVFVNGHFAPELSLLGEPRKNLTITGLAHQLSSGSNLVEHRLIEQHLGQYTSFADGFSVLNTAFAEDGAYLHIPRGVIVEEPIYLLFVSAPNGSPVMSHPRNLILVDQDSQATFVEEYVSLGMEPALCNVITELVAADSSVLSHYRIEREQANTFNISTLNVHQGRNANVASHSVLLGGALLRNNVHPVLAGEGGECLINGLFLGCDRQHIDNYMLVEHASPHCGSRQFYNGILDDHAHGVFHGRIIVHKDAQKTDAKQTNRNLLISDDAQIDTKPQLEIHADDVKCTHGATIGQIDEEALFYLRSRGVDETSARKLLLLAFAGECLERMKQGPVRKHVELLVNQYMPRFANTNPNARHTHPEEVSRAG